MSLFPFLAVLICTMGALILLLVVIARQARLQAAEAASAEKAQQQEKLKEAREDVRWKIDQLRAAREKTEAELAEARLRLGHVEDHGRQLRGQLAGLEASWADLELLGEEGYRRQEQLEAELAAVEVEITEAQHRLAEVQAAAEKRRRSFAVVPYRGLHETDRRPIYLECSAEAITLQPEGIVLTDADFVEPMGPGNPLAAALRAVREYLAARENLGAEGASEPYPLLLVRPDGIAAYYAARKAMKSWASEFGYEMICHDWALAFPPPDPQLAEVLSHEVAAARVRQRARRQQLMAAAPRHYRNQRRQEYTVGGARGGIVPYGGPHGLEDSAGQAPPATRPGSGAFGTAERRWSARTESAARSSADNDTFSGPPRESQASPTPPNGAVTRPGEWQPKAARSAVAGTAGDVQCLAMTRGRDWGLPDAARGSTGIEVPIRVDCYRDRLIILPKQGFHEGKSISLGPQTEASIDGLISAVWECMDGWGIAGKGMYWRPLLKVHVAPDAGRRFDELSVLLDGSGLSVQRAEGP